MTMGDGFFDCASVFPKSVAELTFSFSNVLYVLASGALYHIYMRFEDEQEM